jgi:hypothetical protein
MIGDPLPFYYNCLKARLGLNENLHYLQQGCRRTRRRPGRFRVYITAIRLSYLPCPRWAYFTNTQGAL